MYNVIGDTTLLTNEEWKALRVIGGSTVGAIMDSTTTQHHIWFGNNLLLVKCPILTTSIRDTAN